MLFRIDFFAKITNIEIIYVYTNFLNFSNITKISLLAVGKRILATIMTLPIFKGQIVAADELVITVFSKIILLFVGFYTVLYYLCASTIGTMKLQELFPDCQFFIELYF